MNYNEAYKSAIETTSNFLLGEKPYSIRRTGGNWVILKTPGMLFDAAEPIPTLRILTNRNDDPNGRVTDIYDFFPSDTLRKTITYGDEEVTTRTSSAEDDDLRILLERLSTSSPDTHTEDHLVLLQN